MSEVSKVRFPMARRQDAEQFIGAVEGMQTHVDENGVESTVDVYVVGDPEKVGRLASPFGIEAETVR